MKKTMLVMGMLVIALSACTRKPESSKEAVSPTPLKIDNQFVYTASDNSEVQVTEFNDSEGKECMVVHANYMFDGSVADVSCVASRHKNVFVDNKIAMGIAEKAKIINQVSYKAKETHVQVTTIKSKYNHTCTIVHANYLYDSSTANVDCQP